MLHLVAGVLDIQNKLQHNHSFISYAPATCVEESTCALDSGPWGTEEDANTAAHCDTEYEPSPTTCDVEEAVTVAGKTQLSCELVEEVEAGLLAQLYKMEGNLANHEVEARREGQSSAATSATPQEGGRENSVACEGLVKPSFSPGAPSDSVLTDSGVSEMTNTESDYSDSLEQDDEDAKSSPDGAQPSSSPSSRTKSGVIEFEDSGDGSWFDDQDSSDFFIDANLSHDSGIVEFDPNSEDFTNWDDVKSFFEGLIERQNTELDRISSFEYKPQDQDSYAPCRSVSSDEAEKKQKFGFSLFDDDCLLDTENLVGPFPSSQRHVMHGTVRLPAPKVIKYKYEMRDESWGYSSHEPYFDVLTGQRILSTIYEFEVSSDEDTDSVKVTDDSWHEAGSERHDEAGSVIEEEEEEEEEEAAADEIICGEETKRYEEIPMQRGDAGGGDSSSAANTSSGDSASHDDIILLSEHVSASALSPQGEGREEASEGVGGEKSVDDPMDGSETEKQEPNVMKDRPEDLPAPVPESPRRSEDDGMENGDQKFDNLVSLEATTETSAKQAVGTPDSAITGHTRGGLESLVPTSDVEKGTSFGKDEEKTDRGDKERGTGGSDKEKGTDCGDRSDPLAEGNHEVPFRNLASGDSPSSPRESVLRDDPPDLCLEARPDSPPVAGPEGADGGTAGNAAPQSLESIVTSEGVHHEVSPIEARREGKGSVISQPNEATKDISSLAEAHGDTSRCLVSSEPHRPANAPANDFSGMQKEAESRTENNKSGDEATPIREPFTRPSAPDAVRDLKGDEARPAGTDTLTQESPEEPKTCEPASRVPSGEENITEHQKHSEAASDLKGDEQEYINVVDGDEDVDVILFPVTRAPEPPQRPHRRTHHHNTLESRCPSSAPPPNLATEADVRVTDAVNVPGASLADSSACVDALVTSVGSPTISEAESHEGSTGWGASGSSQGHPDAHTPEGDGKECLMEEEMKELPENSASPPSLKKEMKEEREKIVEESVQATRTLHPLQQQKQVATLSATTTITTTISETEASMIPPRRDRDEVTVEDKPNSHVHDKRKPAQIPSLASPPSAVNKLHPDSTIPSTASSVAHTVNMMATIITATEASPQKPRRSSRRELRKQRTNHVHALDSEGGERNDSGSATPPARPSRRKYNSVLRPEKTTGSVKEQDRKEETQNKETVKQETTAAGHDEAQTIDNRLGGAETREEEKRGSDNKLKTDTEAGGNEISDRRLNSHVTDSEGEQASSDSRLNTIEKIYQDDRLDGGGAGTERERGSDSGSGGASGEEEKVAAGEGSSRGTISAQAEPRACASLAANTNSLGDAAADVRAKGTAQEDSGSDAEGHTAGIIGVIGQHEPKVIENGELVYEKLQTEAVEAEKEEHQEAGVDAPPSRPASSPPDTNPTAIVEVLKSEGKNREELLLGLTAKWDHYDKTDTKEQRKTLGEEAETKATSPPTISEGHVAPPRRKRKVSSSRSLHQEDATIEPDTGQNQTRPIPPVRRKRQFSSLPRPPKTKLPPRDVSPSLSMSALALASTTDGQAATTPLRPASSPTIPAAESPVSPFSPLRPASSPAVPASSTLKTPAAESPAFPSTFIRPASTPTIPAKESAVSPSTPLRPASTPTTSAAEVPAFMSNPSPEPNGAAAIRAARAKPKIKMEVEAACSRRMSAGSTHEERKRRTLKKALRRTGSLKEMLYTQLQHRLDKSSRGEADDGPKMKYFPKIFHRKQKLYDMSCPSEHPSEIPAPAPPQQHLTSESTETFATLLSSYFPPDMEDQGKADGEMRSRYITFEHSPFDPPIDASKEKKTSPAEKTPPCQEHIAASADDSETTALLQESLVSNRESLPAPGEGSVNEGFVHDESNINIEDSPLDGNSDNKQSSQRASDPEKSVSNPAVVETLPEEGNENPDESCHWPPQRDPEEPEYLEDITEDASETTVDEKDEETTAPDDILNGEATEPDKDHSEDWQTQHRDHDHYASRENDTLAPPTPPPPPTPTDEEGHDEGHEESHEQKEEKQAGPVWEPPHVSLRTWAERQGIKSLTLPPLRLRSTHSPDLEALDYYCDSDSSEERDTPSPGPPVDSEKEGRQGLLHKQKKEEDRTQKDRCVEVYPETVRQRQRNMMAANNKVDIQNWESSNNNNNESQASPAKSKKFLPSVKALRNQFEAGKTPSGKTEVNGNVTTNGTNGQTLSRKSSSSSVASTTQEKASNTASLHTPSASVENLGSPATPEEVPESNEPVEPIFNQFRKVDQELRELMSKGHSTTGWDPRPLLKRLYYIPEAPKLQSQGTTYVNIEGYLEKLPSGRKKATFWNAWKRRYFMAKNGILYYYQNAQTDKPSMKMTLMGGKVECMEPNMVGVDDGSRDTKASNMLGIDDGKGHYVVVRCSTRQEAERWRRALETHTVEDFASQYVQPWPIPTNPALLRDTLIVDIGSASVRAGVLASQATLPQVFIPSVVASGREGRGQVWGMDALAPDVRANSSLTFPIRPTHKISKYSVDLSAVSSLLQKTFADLKVDPKNYHVQLSVPRVLNTNTQAELLRVLFDKFGVRSVNLTHQSILALYAYNATSGIVVDIGERMDIVPVIDGYIVDGGVSRVPYGGYRILDHLRQFLYMRNVSLINEVESYIIRQVLENICYCAHHYNTEKARCTKNPDNFEKSVSLAEYFNTRDCPYESISLDFGRFQATEGLFNPDAWGLDHPGLHKLVHKAIMECSMDIRKEMSRSIFLAGGVTQLPGLMDRLTTELDNLTPPAIRPKVHASPYRYHAAYIGACVLAESPAFTQSRITQEDWNKHGNSTLRKWSL